LARVVPQNIQEEITEIYKLGFQIDMNKSQMKFIVRSNKNKY
jgi:hypothetical protein